MSDRSASLSGWAVAAFLCVMAFLCPLMPLVGVLLGIKARSDIRAGRRRGAGLANTAIILGLLINAGWIAGGVWWNAAARRPILDGPIDALQAGLAGDIAAFQAAFHTDPVPAAEATAFLDELNRRYGQLRLMRQPEVEESLGDRPILNDGRVVIPYEMAFTGAAAAAEAEFVVFDDGLVLRFAWIRVDDAVLGPIGYPASAVQTADSPADGE